MFVDEAHQGTIANLSTLRTLILIETAISQMTMDPRNQQAQNHDSLQTLILKASRCVHMFWNFMTSLANKNKQKLEILTLMT